MLDNFEKFKQLREKYNTFIYESFSVENSENEITLKFKFTIEGLTSFEPQIKILKKNLNIDEKMIQNCKNAVFHIGLIELISYWKCTCSPNVIIKAGYINNEQIEWFKKLYFYGLGELFFTNGIHTTIEDFMNVKCDCENVIYEDCTNTQNSGYLIPIGGGKDSCVTLETLKNEKDNYCLIINPKPVTLGCAQAAGYEDDKIVDVKRTIDSNLLDLNKQGFINGHTPFSSLLAFLSYFVADIIGKKYIALSNESSANESNVEGKKINHQYSKSFEFENDFRLYANKYLKRNVEYFSFLRPLNELQIAMEFSKFDKYHNIFKSCNVGSKGAEWKWCCNCPKCLFVYIILSPFLYKEKLVNIFEEDLFEREDLLKTFIELTGNGETKPFECVGTYEEVCFAISKTIENLERKYALKNKCLKENNQGDCQENSKENKNELPYLLKYYKEHYNLSDLSNDLTKKYNNDNNLTREQEEILKKEINS